jgi:hypothetical protein
MAAGRLRSAGARLQLPAQSASQWQRHVSRNLHGANHRPTALPASVCLGAGVTLLLALLSATSLHTAAAWRSSMHCLDVSEIPTAALGNLRKPIRTVLTVLSIAVAFLLFGI